ncbi:hypothetical protein Tcan_07684 [Toxocara canis]|uniref:Uncharacterized protein n=1 Tax=Toxocara canis TaxID=6265 RepID=A0A0B2VRS4_TOXCA|nr:hypothetical protein Tcan_07684 [Toxocara canis]
MLNPLKERLSSNRRSRGGEKRWYRSNSQPTPHLQHSVLLRHGTHSAMHYYHRSQRPIASANYSLQEVNKFMKHRYFAVILPDNRRIQNLDDHFYVENAFFLLNPSGSSV